MGGDSLETKIDRSLLERIIGGIPHEQLKKMSMMDVINRVYDATYMTYQQKYYQEWMMRQAVEKRMIKKNTTIDMLNSRVAQLIHACEEAGVEIPEALSEEEVMSHVRASVSKDSKAKAE